MQKNLVKTCAAARGLFKRPGFSFILVNTFSVGAGATAAIFSVNNAGGLSKPLRRARPPISRGKSKGSGFAPATLKSKKLSEGVYAAIRKQPPLFSFDPNNVFIINDDDVIVVDANASLAATKRITGGAAQADRQAGEIRHQHALARRSHRRQPGWREAFPGVEFIGHASALKDRPTTEPQTDGGCWKAARLMRRGCAVWSSKTKASRARLSPRRARQLSRRRRLAGTRWPKRPAFKSSCRRS